MNGQIWEECFCGIAPICAQCMKCQKHCTCDQPKQTIDFETLQILEKDNEFSMPHPARVYK